MKIAILAAMNKELGLLLKLMPDYTEVKADGMSYYRGVIGNKNVVIGQCGIGKVNSAISAYKMIEAEKPDMVINSGVAGGVDGSLKVGSVLIADKIAYHDVWCGPGTEYGAADGFPRFIIPSPVMTGLASDLFCDNEEVYQGLICSGDKFVHLKEEVDEIKKNFPEAKAVDMESASIAQVCMMKGVPCAVVRVMSDTPGAAENISQYKNFWDKAPEKSFLCVRAMIEAL